MSLLNSIIHTIVNKVQTITETFGEHIQEKEMILPTNIPSIVPMIPLQEIVIHSWPNTVTIYYVNKK